MSDSVSSTRSSPPQKPPKRGVLRRYLPLLLLAGGVGLGMLKLADVVVGRVRNTRERHLLRLVPESHLRHRSNEFNYDFQTNRLGLRGPDVDFQKPAGTFRIVMLGDSFVAGYGVAEEHLLTTLLEQNLRREFPQGQSAAARHAGVVDDDQKSHKVEVVNVGRAGSSTIRELDLYEALGRRFQPDLVILAYYLGNDLAEVTQEQTRPELAEWHPDGWTRRWAFAWYPNLYLELALIRLSRRQLREFTQRSEREIVDDLRQEARARGRNPEEVEANYESLPQKIRQDVAAGMLSEVRIVNSCIEPDYLVRALDPDPDEFASAWARTAEHLVRLRRAVERDGAQLVVVAIPAPYQIDRESLEFHRALGFRVKEGWLESQPPVTAALTDWARHANVPFLDLTAEFRHATKPLYFIEDLHFNPAGHAAAAEAIRGFLLSRGLCP